MIKKAAISGVFVYAISAIIIILVVYFGYRGITSFSQANEEQVAERLKLQMKSDLSRLSLKYGTSAVLNYPVPKTYSRICFVDLNTEHGSQRNTKLEEISYLMYDSVVEGSQNNAFLLGEEFSGFDAGKLRVNCTPYVICFNTTRGRVSFRAEGGGDAVVIPCQ